MPTHKPENNEPRMTSGSVVTGIAKMVAMPSVVGVVAATVFDLGLLPAALGATILEMAYTPMVGRSSALGNRSSDRPTGAGQLFLDSAVSSGIGAACGVLAVAAVGDVGFLPGVATGIATAFVPIVIGVNNAPKHLKENFKAVATGVTSTMIVGGLIGGASMALIGAFIDPVSPKAELLPTTVEKSIHDLKLTESTLTPATVQRPAPVLKRMTQASFEQRQVQKATSITLG